jgi:molecular chaperone GrpE
MTTKGKKINNLYANDMFKRQKPTEKKGSKRQEGEPFLEEELEKEAEDIEELEKELADKNLQQESTEELQEEVTELQEALDESRNKLLAAHAEVENVRRRAQQDVTKAHKYALEKFVAELLPVIDSLEHALDNAKKHKSDQAMLEGIELTSQKLLATLQKFGVKQINPLNEPFDPQYHEAMTMVENPDVAANTVIDVFQKGYELNGRLVRPARVVVAK